jgi:hypothetical protein
MRCGLKIYAAKPKIVVLKKGGKLSKQVKLSRYRHAGAKTERSHSSYSFLT